MWTVQLSSFQERQEDTKKQQNPCKQVVPPSKPSHVQLNICPSSLQDFLCLFIQPTHPPLLNGLKPGKIDLSHNHRMISLQFAMRAWFGLCISRVFGLSNQKYMLYFFTSSIIHVGQFSIINNIINIFILIFSWHISSTIHFRILVQFSIVNHYIHTLHFIQKHT